jgi:hypothetical protein
MPKIKLEGVGAFNRALDKVHRDLGRSFVAASERAAQSLLRETAPLVPVETGALLASGDFIQDGKGWETQTIIGYGFDIAGMPGPVYMRGNQEKIPAEYAVIQHDEYPQKRTSGTTMYYLELGIDYNFEYLSDIFYTYMQSGIK